MNTGVLVIRFYPKYIQGNHKTAVRGSEEDATLLSMEEFLSTLKNKDDIFLVTVNVGANIILDQETIQTALKNIERHLIIEILSSVSTKVYIKYPDQEELIIIDLNIPAEQMSKEDLFIKLKNKDRYGIPLTVEALKQGLIGHFNEGSDSQRSLTDVTFIINEASPEGETGCILLDYALLHNDTLSLSWLSLHIYKIIYDVIRSNNVIFFMTLNQKYKDHYLMKIINNILPKVYEEIILKGVSLTKEMRFVIEDRIINFSFFIDKADQNIKEAGVSLCDVHKRIEMISQCIQDLETKYLGKEGKDVDGGFIFIARVIAQNIQILKKQLRITYDRLPWEEMEFCLVRFISCYTEPQELDFICKIVLNKRLIQVYLEEFLVELINVKDSIKEEDVNKGFPKQVNKSHLATTFKRYENYEMIKNVYSLQRIDHYVTLALDIDLDKQEERVLGPLVIERALQVLGEGLKNTPESPNVSNDVHAILLLSAPKNMREIVTQLRNSLSHYHTLRKKKELENCNKLKLNKIQNDLKKIKIAINQILHNIKIDAEKILFSKFIDCYELSQFKELLKYCNVNKKIGKVTDVRINEQEKIKYLIKDLSNLVQNQTEDEVKFFGKIDKSFKLHQNILSNDNLNYIQGLQILKSLIDKTEENSKDLRNIKSYCRMYLKSIQSSNVNLKKISELLIEIYKSVELRGKMNDDIRILFFKIIFFIDFGAGHIQGINEFKEMLLKKEYDTESKVKETIERIFDEIKDFLKEESTVESKTFEIAFIEKQNSYTIYKENKELKKQLFFLYDKLKDGQISKNDFSVKWKYKETVKILIDKKLDNIHKSLTNGDWKEVKKLADKLCNRDSYETLLNSVKNSIKEESHDISQYFQEFVRSLSLNKSLKSSINIIIDKIFKNKERIQILFQDRLQILERLLSFSNNYKSDSELQAAVEMIVLDLTEILETSELLGDNQLFIERQSPLLMGKMLRNYLAHGNALVDILPCDPSAAILSNALRLIKEGKYLVMKKNVFIGQRIGGNSFDLYNDYRHSLDIVTNQNDMFTAAKEGNLEKMKHHIKEGADIKARDYRGWSGLHFAAQGNNVEVLEFFLDLNIHIDTENNDGQTCFHIAATFNSIDVIKYLLGKGGDVNSVNKDNQTALQFASENGHLDVVRLLLLIGVKEDINGAIILAVKNGYSNIVDFLLKNGANVDVLGSYNDSLLHWGSLLGHLDVINTLLKNNIKIGVKSLEGWTALHYATVICHITVIETLLTYVKEDERYDFINAKDNVGRTALHLASYHDHGVVRLLLDNGADINATSFDGKTPLHLATLAGNVSVIETLLEYGADIDYLYERRYSALHLAAALGQKNLVHLFVEGKSYVDNQDKNGITPLIFALCFGHEEVVETLLSKTDYIADTYKNGVSPLHIASYMGYLKIIKLLLNKNANINALDENGCTPLNFAAYHGKTNSVNLLLDEGAKFDISDQNGMMPLHLAAMKGHNDIVKRLVNDETKLNFTNNEDGSLLKLSDMIHVRDKDGKTPLFHAVISGHLEVFESLLNKGAKEDVRDNDGSTVLHWAALSGHPAIVKCLLDRKTDYNVLNRNNDTPLHFATITDGKFNYEIVQMLLDAGAQVYCINNFKMTPINNASIIGNENVIRILLNNMSDDDFKRESIIELFYSSATHGFVKVIETLLECGAHIDVSKEYMYEVMLTAIACGRTNIVQLLLEKKVYYVSKDIESSDILFLAFSMKDQELIETLLNKIDFVDVINDKHQSLLHLAVYEGNSKIIKVLLNKKADINALDENGFAPLHMAACNGKIDVLNLLLDEGAVFDIRDQEGWMPLHFAAFQGHDDIVERLLDEETKVVSTKNKVSYPLQSSDMIHVSDKDKITSFEQTVLNGGVKKRINDDNGVALLHLLVFGGHADLFKHILKIAVGCNNEDKNNDTSFLLGTESDSSGYEENVQMLLNVEAKDVALNFATGLGRNNIYKRLLKEENKVEDEENEYATLLQISDMTHVKYNEGITPLLYAKLRGHKEVVQRLMNGGIKEDSKDYNDWIWRHLAAGRDYEDIIKRLFEKNSKCNVENSNDFMKINKVAKRMDDVFSFLHDKRDDARTKGNVVIMSLAESMIRKLSKSETVIME